MIKDILWITKKYYYILVIKPNALLLKKLLNDDGDRFCLNCFCNFQTDEVLKIHDILCKNYDHINMIIPEKLKTV